MFILPKETEIDLVLLQEFLDAHAKEVKNRFQKLKDAYESDHEIMHYDKKPAHCI